MIVLRVAGRRRLRIFALRDAAGSVASGRLTGGMQRTEKGDQRGGFRGTEIFSVRGHISSTLNYLTDELVLSETHGDRIEGGTALSAKAIESVAIVTLFGLEDGGALHFERGAMREKFWWDGFAAPGIHVRTPRRVAREMSEGCQRDGDEQDGEHRDGAPAPTLFTFTRQKWQQEQGSNGQHRADE